MQTKDLDVFGIIANVAASAARAQLTELKPLSEGNADAALDTSAITERARNSKQCAKRGRKKMNYKKSEAFVYLRMFNFFFSSKSFKRA